jgi:hypothetical protein
MFRGDPSRFCQEFSGIVEYKDTKVIFIEPGQTLFTITDEEETAPKLWGLLGEPSEGEISRVAQVRSVTITGSLSS